MSIGHNCGHLNYGGVQYTFVVSCLTADAYILIRVHLVRCPVWFDPLFDNIFTVCSPVTFLLQENTRVKRDRPQVTTRPLS